MSMNKNIDNAGLNQYTDNVIRRGYEIYDEWVDKKQDSRKIVASAEGAVKLFKKRKNMAAFVDALAYLFALDMRIKEKYHPIWRCLFSFFSWRRETRALDFLKGELNIPLGVADIRDVIAVEIEKLVEKLENGWDEDGDDETHGGKRNGKSGEEDDSAEEKQTEEPAEENPEAEEIVEKEETKKDSEKKEEEKSAEETSREDEQEEIGEETAEPEQVDAETTATDEIEEPVQETEDVLKEENNVSDEESEPSTDKKEEARSYNDAVDFSFLIEEPARDRSSEQISFIDEMILDDMVKGNKGIMGYQRIQGLSSDKDAGPSQDTVANQNEENKSTDKDAYLYDKMIADDKGEAPLTEQVEATQQAPKVEATQQTQKLETTQQPQTGEAEQSKETVQNNGQANTTEPEVKSMSETLQTNHLNRSQENKLADDINLTMSLDSKLAFVRMQEDQMREHMRITLEELGMDNHVEVIGISEPTVVNPPIVSQSRK